MAANPEILSIDMKMRRERPRVESFANLNKADIVERVIKFYTDDNQDRSAEIDMRLQRYAKYRMWTEPKNFPWEDSSNMAMPDLMTASMRLQDTLHNAVMSSRPCVMAKATKKHDEEKTEPVDQLLDYQVFVEQPGEETIGALAHDFVNEGFFTAYVPWVKEMRHVVDVFVLGELQPGVMPLDFFRDYLEGKFPKAVLIPGGQGWDWTVEEGEGKKKKKHRASFFTREDGDVEVEIEMEAIRFNGPKIIADDVQNIFHPVRCENLQMPGPSNPGGASHVIRRDYPSVDELRRLRKSGFYDLMTADEALKLGVAKKDESYTEREQQKDALQGATQQKPGPEKGIESHGQLTRLMCFDCYDVDGDGVDEDVIWWVILETKTLVRARYLTQMFPSNPPMRPFAEAHLFPVPGRRFSIGLLEMMEGLHDAQKQFLDQGGDAGTIANVPYFFYRASSNMRPETIRLYPGEGYPLNDPQRDVHFPQMGDRNQTFMFNMLSFLNQMEERLTTIGELQLGRVPHGKASALRTVSGMQTVLSQGDARPERVLRRFFIGLTQIWRLCHTLNQAFLPKNKQILITGNVDPSKDPYRTIEGPDKIAGSFMFDFSANALNTSKEALQMALQDLMGVYVSELALTLGIIKPDGIYRLLRDYGKAKGPDPDKYLSPPTPTALHANVFAEEALSMMMSGQIPQGGPAEGAQAHLEKLMAFTQSDEFGFMPAEYVGGLLKPYMERIAQQAQQEAMAAQLMAAAQQFGQRVAQPGKTGPAAMPQGPGGMPALQSGELADETLPGAGGGANAEAA
jgi:hypothetical protein